jgi:hypothetical protein
MLSWAPVPLLLILWYRSRLEFWVVILASFSPPGYC